jgi:homoserine dehydrogenase
MRIHYLLVGLGNIGRRFCEILLSKGALLRSDYDLDLHLVGAADSRGVAVNDGGLDLATVVRMKLAGDSIADYPENGCFGRSAVDLVAGTTADLLLEASPVNMDQGAEPALTCIRTALNRGMHVVTCNKGPIVLAHNQLQRTARQNGVSLRFDGTVAGGLPAINIGQRDLKGSVITRLESVPNLVTGFIMDLLADGLPWEAATSKARAEGVLEGNGEWDLEGWDAAAKLAILAKTVLAFPAQLGDVSRRGITDLSPEAIRNARERNLRYRLLACARQLERGQYELSVRPVALSPSHPLGRLGRKQMGVVYHTDIFGTLTTIIEEENPVPSAAAMLRDILTIYSVPRMA